MNQKEERIAQRRIFVGKDAVRVVNEELGSEYYLSEIGQNHFSVTAFSGTRGKPDFKYWYPTEAARTEEIESWLERLRAAKAWKAEQSAKNNGKRPLTGAALCAKAIREELAKAFPDTKFRVNSSNFSMGNSVDIRWTDGPTSAAVRAITDKYQYGSFNGMEDIYEYDNSRNDIPQAKYVQTQNELSNERREAIKASLSERYGVDMNDQQAVMATFNRWPDVVIWQEFNGVLY